MRKMTVILALALCGSLLANVLVMRRMTELQSSVRSGQASLALAGQRAGELQAASDFAAGEPRWYVIGDFGGGGVPAGKAGRKLATVGCLVSEYDTAFVQSYNETMDERLASAAATRPAP